MAVTDEPNKPAIQMSTDLAAKKKELRLYIREKVKSLSTGQRDEFSRQACALLMEQKIWRTAKSILFYSPLRDELDLFPLLHQALTENKIVALPRFVSTEKVYAASQISNFKEDCAPGKFGIHEPSENCPMISLNQLDLVLVPGVAFDPTGHRLGRGQGYYDRLLARVSGIKCGVAFDEQLVPGIPAEPHDVRLNCILTPTRWLFIDGPPAVLT